MHTSGKLLRWCARTALSLTLYWSLSSICTLRGALLLIRIDQTLHQCSLKLSYQLFHWERRDDIQQLLSRPIPWRLLYGVHDLRWTGWQHMVVAQWGNVSDSSKFLHVGRPTAKNTLGQRYPHMCCLGMFRRWTTLMWKRYIFLAISSPQQAHWHNPLTLCTMLLGVQ